MARAPLDSSSRWAPLVASSCRRAGPLIFGLLTSGLVVSCGASEKEVRAGAVGPVGSAGAGGSDMDDRGQGGSEVMDGTAQGVEQPPSLEDGTYVFRAGDLEFAVDPAVGGRVVRFSLGGTNILTGPEVVAGGTDTLPNMYGSTFWTSPQSDWNWPPETAIDSDAHVARVEGNVLSLSSEPGATTGYAVQKRFWADRERQEITLEYSLENRSATRPAAPWEISRVPKEGLVFFAAESAPLTKSSLPYQFTSGITWIDIAQAPSKDSKLFQDGSEGWLAYAYRDLVFIKLFEDVSAADQAAGEAEIEVFVNGTMEYVEIEQQGRYAMVPAGGSSAWRVTWLLRRRPSELPASAGNMELVNWVRDIVLDRAASAASPL